MCNFLKEFFTQPRLRVTNFVIYGLIALGIILRFILADEGENGVGRTPTFLFIVQLLLTFVFLGLLICGELHKPVSILMCFPLLMSRVGRGAIIIILALPVTNWLDFSTILIALVGAAVGTLNISVGWHDGPVELKYAEDGLPGDIHERK